METRSMFMDWKTKIIQMLVLPEVIYRYTQNPTVVFCINSKKNHPAIHMESQETLNSQTILKKRKTALEKAHILISKWTTKIKQSKLCYRHKDKLMK